MLAEFGFGVLVLTFALALFSVGAAAYGFYKKSDRWVESSRRAMQLTFPLIGVSALSLIYLLVNDHFELEFVYSVTSRSMPTYLKVTALWGGQAGSLLFWSLLMSAFATAVTLRRWDRDREFLPWVIIVTSVTLIFFLSLTIFFENPFNRWWQTASGEVTARMFAPAGAVLGTPADGQGLNELLRHPGMVFHPPMLYLGFVAFVIPYAFAIAALVTGRTDDRWIRITRRWTLVGWLFLSIGLVLGMRWAYDLLGWGAYWFWDPVEVAALLPWLAATPFIHSVMIQEKRGLFKQWNMLLIILTYFLVILGTFLSRTGVLSSVHAFAQSNIGPLFLVFLFLTLAVGVALVIYRWKDLRAEVEMTSWLSREALFLINNLLFIAILAICLWSELYPLARELFTGERITFGPPWFEMTTGPFWGALVALMGLAPLSAWGHSTVRTLGRAVWKPAIPSLAVSILLFAAGIRNWIGLLGFTLVAFALFITLYEFWRGARARQQAHQESLPVALVRLAGRNRRRYGGYITHLAVVVMAIGVLGIEVFQTQTQRNMAIGDQVELRGYSLRYDSLAQFPYEDGRMVTRAVLSVFRDGNYLGEIYPRDDVYLSGQPVTIPGLRSSLTDDIYAVLVNWEDVSPSQTPFRIYHNPLINWLWIGGFVFVAGILIAAWPQKDEEAG
jgi:cytochrome c-type biogenesis protein CcmF